MVALRRFFYQQAVDLLTKRSDGLCAPDGDSLMRPTMLSMA
jgi:hypothetical protein